MWMASDTLNANRAVRKWHEQVSGCASLGSKAALDLQDIAALVVLPDGMPATNFRGLVLGGIEAKFCK